MMVQIWASAEVDWANAYAMIEMQLTDGEETTLPIHIARLDSKIDAALNGKFDSHPHLLYFLETALPNFVKALLGRG